MGFFLSKTWPFWLLAALLAALIAWLLCRWWAGRRRDAGSGAGSLDLTTTQALLRTRESEVKRLTTERASHLEELAVLRPKAAAHDDLATQVDGLRAGSVPIGEHQARIDHLNNQVSTLTGHVGDLEGQAGQVSGLQARIAELEGQANQVGGLQARIHDLEGQAAQRDSAKPDLAGAAHALGFSVTIDDLTVVEGIGPKIAELCQQGGIQTWRQLAQTPVSRLQEILDAAGPRYQIHNPGTWPKQAALLADGHWEPFKSWTDQLKGGRTSE